MLFKSILAYVTIFLVLYPFCIASSLEANVLVMLQISKYVKVGNNWAIFEHFPSGNKYNLCKINL